MAPTIVNQVSNNSGGSAVTSLSVSTSSAPVVGDLLVFFHTNDFSSASNMTAPSGSGWTLRATGDDGLDNSHVKCWTREVVSSGTQTVTANQSSPAFLTVHLYVIRDHGGVDTATGGNDTTDSTTHTMSSISSAGADELLIDCLSCKRVGDYTSGPGTKRSEQDVSPEHTAACYDRVVGSGALGSRSATFSVTQVSASNTSILIKPANSVIRATEFYVQSTRWVKSIWYYRDNTAVVPTWMRLYKVTSAKSGEGVLDTYRSIPSQSGTGWKEILFPEPIILEANTRYRACVLFTGTMPLSTSNYWTSGAGANGLINGEMIAPKKSDAIGQAQGSYANSDVMVFPTLSDGSNYWVDVTLVDTPYS